MRHDWLTRSSVAAAALILNVLPAVSWAEAAPRQPKEPDDVANIPSEERRAGGNERQRYFLIGPDPDAPGPEGGYGLLLVLPGGDGGADFHPFVKRIFRHALPPGYLVAQLVAVPSDNQDQIVWPTERSPDPKQDFSTESFIKAVVEEVKAAHKIDDRRVFTLSWSSGGPAAYAVSLTPDSPVRGSLIAMSVFIERRLPPLSAAEGHRYYLLHSPQDRVCRYAFTQAARDRLSAHGATVTLADYEGGHGWHGDVFGQIRRGVEWLEGADEADDGGGNSGRNDVGEPETEANPAPPVETPPARPRAGR